MSKRCEVTVVGDICGNGVGDGKLYCSYHSCPIHSCPNLYNCEHHSCVLWFCNDRREKNKQYCYKHCCPALGCNQQSYPEPCKIHLCQRSLLDSICYKLRMCGGQFCVEHSCRVEGCKNYIYRCDIHTKKQCNMEYCQSFAQTDMNYCVRHLCEHEGCGNRIHECFIHKCSTLGCANIAHVGWKKCLLCLTYTDVFVTTDYARIIPKDIVNIIITFV